MKILCPRGHRIAEVTRDGSRWMIEITRAPECMMLGADGQLTTGTRYPDREPLGARPRRQLACPRECAREYSWYQAESADLERLAATGLASYQMTARTG